MSKNFSKCIILITILFICSCSNVMYHNSKEQGFIPEDNKIAQLKVGMSTLRVIEIAGEPTLKNILDENKWAYVKVAKDGSSKSLVLNFKNDKLIKITQS